MKKIPLRPHRSTLERGTATARDAPPEASAWKAQAVCFGAACFALSDEGDTLCVEGGALCICSARGKGKIEQSQSRVQHAPPHLMRQQKGRHPRSYRGPQTERDLYRGQNVRPPMRVQVGSQRARHHAHRPAAPADQKRRGKGKRKIRGAAEKSQADRKQDHARQQHVFTIETVGSRPRHQHDRNEAREIGREQLPLRRRTQPEGLVRWRAAAPR